MKERMFGVLKSPIALAGLIPVAIVLAVLVAGVWTAGGFSVAQDGGTATATTETAQHAHVR